MLTYLQGFNVKRCRCLNAGSLAHMTLLKKQFTIVMDSILSCLKLDFACIQHIKHWRRNDSFSYQVIEMSIDFQVTAFLNVDGSQIWTLIIDDLESLLLQQVALDDSQGFDGTFFCRNQIYFSHPLTCLYCDRVVSSSSAVMRLREMVRDSIRALPITLHFLFFNYSCPKR